MQVNVLPDLLLLSIYCLSSYFQASAQCRGCIIPIAAGTEHEAAFRNKAAQAPTSTRTYFLSLYKLSDAI